MRPGPVSAVAFPEGQGPAPRRARSVAESFRFATAGLVHALRTQRNLRIHFLLALLVMVLALAVRLSRLELAVLVLTVAVVLVAELVNTAVEAAVDLFSPQLHDLARIAKNVAAGAVMVSAIGAVVVGILLFYQPLMAVLAHPSAVPARHSQSYLTLVGTSLTLLFTWAGKSWLTRPVRLAGGMPSGHSAVAWALATAIYLAGAGPWLSLIGAVLAGLVAESRLEAGLHDVWEVAAGAALGVGVMAGVFLLLG
ncbi:diacylglycerol kinase [Carboxydochorda subterranea]|uniref:Diacylglycerol kinase n=1 Tax=Carboxydichorda subterranea TaxID=3109565 RepID=A0ABZ1C0C3_9FIRM|nr:diacylglycerol kinase [Limnochorda sp. L945t]WRP18285.1 diacylglycerol kinase [Limnochorda sp. L945t]